MKKTLVLIVDRDDDFGVKGNIESPVIGVEECSVAATALGIADPEDSDINAIYAAINIYKDLKSSKQDVEIALICGDQKVGYKSDARIVDELEIIIEKINPGRVILVSDGAEDEAVYPIISSRIPIDSVKKVYVKQSPGIEGTVYIISKILEDPAKRKRFISPIGWMILIISLIYLIPPLFAYYENGTSLSDITTPSVVFIIGSVLVLYANNMGDKLSKWNDKWIKKVKHGNIAVVFALLASLFVVSGIAVGFNSLSEVYLTNFIEKIFWFVSNCVWLVIFGILLYKLGNLIDEYILTKTIRLSFIISSTNIIALGLVIMGFVDTIMFYFGIGIQSSVVCVAELVVGFALAFVSSIFRRYVKQVIIIPTEKETETDAIL